MKIRMRIGKRIKERGIKGQTTIYKTPHRKSSNTNLTKYRGELMCSGRVGSS
jgi:hypothetical protein